MLSLRYAELVYYGLWFTPLREALDAFFASSEQRVAGSVRFRLYKGNLTVLRRESPFSLYRTRLASFTMDGYNPKDAAGFINLFALPVTPSADASPSACNAAPQASPCSPPPQRRGSD
jgi:argininosuccinate synthase